VHHQPLKTGIELCTPEDKAFLLHLWQSRGVVKIDISIGTSCFDEEIGAAQEGQWGEASRKVTCYTKERVTFFIILEVLLTT
jgi:hypothetical protein